MADGLRQQEALVRLSRAHLRPRDLLGLLRECGGEAEAVLSSDAKHLPEDTQEKLIKARSDKDAARDLDRLSELGARLVAFGEEAYPKLLRQIHDPPPILYVRGDLPPNDPFCVAIVGTRRAGQLGLRIAEQLAADLAIRGVTVVSGMAFGIDRAAHQGALGVKGRTIAALGCALDVYYPSDAKELYEETARSGALVSEYPLGTLPTRHTFPERNRIIAGLSAGAVVVEAPLGSGALITAGIALEEGRELMVVPGSPLDLRYEGSLNLLREGAKLIRCANDVLEELGFQVTPITVAEGASPDLSEDERLVLDRLDPAGVMLDNLIASSNISPQAAQSALLLLELKGLVKKLPGNVYARAARQRSLL